MGILAHKYLTIILTGVRGIYLSKPHLLSWGRVLRSRKSTNRPLSNYCQQTKENGFAWAAVNKGSLKAKCKLL